MNLCDISEVKALLDRHHFHFTKAKGQNFLTASWVPREIAEGAGIDRTCGVLEIGPGIGPLTSELCQAAGKVVAIEVDTSLRPILAETMDGFDNLELIFGDAMKTDLRRLVSEKFQGLRPTACANLPYYITSPVLIRLMESECFESITVMVQKEVAQRMCARSGDSSYSAFSVLCRYYTEPEILFEVPADCFLPRPKVTSAVVRLVTRREPLCRIDDKDFFFRAVRSAFGQRRKTLVNGLSSGFPELGKSLCARAIEECGFSADIRGEKLDLEGFASLSNALLRLKQTGV